MRARTLAVAASAAAILVATGVAVLRRQELRSPSAGAWPGSPTPVQADGAVPDPSRPGPAPGVPPPADSAPPEAPPPHEPAAPAVTHRGVLRPAVPRTPAPGAQPWEAVETALRPAALGPDLAAPVSDGLAEARDGMQYCFDQEASALAREHPAGSATGGVAAGPAVLVLQLEALEGKLSIAGVEVASLGTSSRRLVECCRAALVGFEFAAPAARPPERYKVTMPLM